METNEQVVRKIIQSLSLEELADLLIKRGVREDWDYDYDEEPFFWGTEITYMCSDGEMYIEEYDEAIEHECWWLEQEAKERPNISYGKNSIS